MNTIHTLYAGGLRSLPPEGQQTGFFKVPIESADLGTEGFIGDRQADRRYHGGPEKALHQYALQAYETIQASFPQLVNIAVPGSMGENLSSAGLSDTTVCIGDIYRLGRARVQVSQPRTPCWKINHKFGLDKLSLFIEQQRICGWYYRVLETGRIFPGDEIELLDRPNPDVSVEYFLRIRAQHRPEIDALNLLINCVGLNLEWKNRLLTRKDFLSKLS